MIITGATNYSKRGKLTVLWMTPGVTICSAIYGLGGLIMDSLGDHFEGVTNSMMFKQW